MNIILIGYGKMGQLIEKIATNRGHEIIAIVDQNNKADLEKIVPKENTVAIEFSTPDAAFGNITTCLNNGIKVISGTTGWLHQIEQVKLICKQKEGTFLYASNFSLGVNLFFKINEQVARLMSRYESYQVSIQEKHHTHKLDAPSGTAITIAEGIMAYNDSKSKWVNQNSDKATDLAIISKRKGEVPGTHKVAYSSFEDTISIKHKAHSRNGFALGAMMVAEWISDQKGFKTMDDFLGF